MRKNTQETQKITAYIPVKLLQEAQEATHQNITDTLKAGLEKLTLQKAYQNLLSLEGKFDPKIDLKELRKDKDHYRKLTKPKK